VKRSITALLVAGSIVVGGSLTTSCGSDTKSAGSTATSTSPSEASMTKPVVTIPDGDPPTKLEITDLTVGDGAEAVAGKNVSVQYVGVAWSSKKEFDASWDRGQPFTFGLGAGQVIQGWDQGVVGMKVGGRRQLVIPADLGYGSRGAGGVIKPGETLVFVVDLISVG
jgi:peptidylprolyl isomerase